MKSAYPPNHKHEPTVHHVPPKSKGPTQFTLIKKRNHHMAYNTLFKNAGSLQECIEILKRDWWTPSHRA